MPQTQEVWTVPAVKAALPAVKVRIAGKVFDGKVSGRACPFAAVTVNVAPALADSRHCCAVRFEAAWETVAHCLNVGRPILY